MIGRVVSTKSKNTATVLVERTASHSLYGKTFIRSKKYLTEDELRVSLGDMVEILPCAPVSKRKSWKIVKIVGKNLAEVAEEKLKEEAEKIVAEVMPEEKKEVQEESEPKMKKAKKGGKVRGTT